MPTPAKTSREALVGFALELVEKTGADALTMAAVAEAAGVRGPSLYKHFNDRAALLSAVTVAIMHDLEATIRKQTSGRTGRQRLSSMANAYRHFALSHKHAYRLMFAADFADDPAIAEASRFSVAPLFEELAAAGIPPKRLLAQSRVLVALLHGFVSMEIAQAFRLGGDVDSAFEEGLRTLLDGL
ncbi:MAG: WHG domain-containing protein [Devosia sp.]